MPLAELVPTGVSCISRITNDNLLHLKAGDPLNLGFWAALDRLDFLKLARPRVNPGLKDTITTIESKGCSEFSFQH